MTRSRAFKLTLSEKKLLKRQGYEPLNFLRLKKDAESYTFLEVYSGKELVIRR